MHNLGTNKQFSIIVILTCTLIIAAMLLSCSSEKQKQSTIQANQLYGTWILSSHEEEPNIAFIEFMENGQAYFHTQADTLYQFGYSLTHDNIILTDRERNTYNITVQMQNDTTITLDSPDWINHAEYKRAK